MKISEYIASAIDRLPKGYVFTYADFMTGADKRETVIKALNRMAGAGKLKSWPKANTISLSVHHSVTCNPARHKW